MLAYTGERGEALPGFYRMGSRYYSVVARSFVSPDTSSPFDRGGLNRYAYCGGDPINRNDPTGEAWWTWLVAGVGMALAVAGAVASGGALVSAVGAAGGLMSALATSSGATAAAAAVIDVVSVAAEIGATVSLATNNTSLGAIFGWVGLGTGIVSSAVGAAAWRVAKNARVAKDAARSPKVRRAEGYMGAVEAAMKPVNRIIDVPERSVGSVPARLAEPGSEGRTHLYRFTHPDNNQVIRYAVDSKINAFDALAIVDKIAGEHPNAQIYYHYGSHGAASGNNWVGDGAARVRIMPETQKRIDAENRFLKGFVTERGGSLRSRFHPELPRPASDLPSMYRRAGVHLDTACYGAADRDLAELFRTHPVPAAHF
ncbi:MAG: RHS repeat-associated core domain-containing protein [Luteibacter sp.]